MQLQVFPSWSWKAAVSLVSLSVSVSWFCYYQLYQRSFARLVHGLSSDMRDPVRRILAKQIETIITLCPELSNPRYVPTFWAADRWSNLMLLLVKESFNRYFLRPSWTRDVVTISDGGKISIDWANDPTSHLPSTAPVVIFLHTVTGSSGTTWQYTRDAAARGWRACVFNRRGHGGIDLTSPSFNCMGDAEDTVAQVQMVTARYPAADYLAMVGISAGSGLVINYLGKEGDRTPVRAACSLCPAYDISQAFTKLALLYPLVDSYLLASVKKHFIDPNQEILSKKSQTALKDCTLAKTTHQFLSSNFPFAGCNSVEDYFAANNPMEWIRSVKRPFLLVNSEDDMVCLPSNIQEDVVSSIGGAVLLRTVSGSHIAFNEGVLGTGCYLSRITMDFLEAARVSHFQM